MNYSLLVELAAGVYLLNVALGALLWIVEKVADHIDAKDESKS